MMTSILLLFLLFSILTLILSQKCDVSNINKSDCGYIGITQSQCEAKSCCWQELDAGSSAPWVYIINILFIYINYYHYYYYYYYYISVIILHHLVMH